MRSSLKSARYAQGVSDLQVLARDLAVDIVLTGSILRTGDRVRVSAELVSVPAGDVWWSRTTHVPVHEALEIHDDLARHVVASLPLTSADRARPPQAGAASPEAFDLYLRGMQLRTESATWLKAYDFFERCLALDPSFAPAWAERGRLDRVLGKWEALSRQAQAESAFLRALSLDPDNGAAQYYYAQLEIDVGRLEDALERLLARVHRRRAEPHVYAALVHACRYAGLLAESVAAHHEAQRLDPTIATSVHHTYYMQGDYARALAAAPQTSDPFEPHVLGAMGRDAEALAATGRDETRFGSSPALGAFVTGLRAALDGRADDTIAALAPLETVWHSDGEALFYAGGIYARAGLRARALAMLDRAVTAGFLCLPAFERDAYLAPLREGELWHALMARLEPAHRRAVDRFTRAGGPSVLGPAMRT